jgi:hypothetical protein
VNLVKITKEQNIIVHLLVELGANPIIRYQMVSIRRSPTLPPPSGEPPWRVATAPPTRTFSLTTWKIRPSNLPTREEVGGGERYEWRLGLAHFHNEYSFLMISQMLYDISLFFLLIPSPF